MHTRGCCRKAAYGQIWRGLTRLCSVSNTLVRTPRTCTLFPRFGSLAALCVVLLLRWCAVGGCSFQLGFRCAYPVGPPRRQPNTILRYGLSPFREGFNTLAFALTGWALKAASALNAANTWADTQTLSTGATIAYTGILRTLQGFSRIKWLQLICKPALQHSRQLDYRYTIADSSRLWREHATNTNIAHQTIKPVPRRKFGAQLTSTMLRLLVGAPQFFYPLPLSAPAPVPASFEVEQSATEEQERY